MKRTSSLTLTAVLIPCCSAYAAALYPTVSVQDLKAALDSKSGESEAFVLDVRTPAEYADGHIAGSILIPLSNLPARLKEVPSNKTVYVICRSGNRSKTASDLLYKAGRTVKDVSGGMNAWANVGYPVSR